MISTPKLVRVFRVLTNWKLLVYNLLIVLYGPRLLIDKLRIVMSDSKRYAKHHFDPKRLFCSVLNPQPKSNAPHIVFVGIGFGEMRIIDLLTTALREKRPDIQITWAFRDRDAIKTVLEEKPDQPVTFMPFDFLPPVLYWLAHLSPDIVVSAEKIILPNLICASQVWGAQTILSSGRTSRFKKAGLSKLIYHAVQSWNVAHYTTICIQGEAELTSIYSRLQSQDNLRITGAIKLSRSKQLLLEGAARLEPWMSSAQNLPVFAAGSTHEGEEELVLDAFDIVRAQEPCALLLAPRFLSRMEEVRALLQERGYEVSLRSSFQNQGISEDDAEKAEVEKSEIGDVEKRPLQNPSQVYFLDTLGELSSAFHFCVAAYVGGTLRGHGHNIIEPLEWGMPVFFGPGNGLLVAPQVLCEEAGVGFRVHNAEELAAHWLNILRDSKLREFFRERSQQVMQQQYRALEDNVTAIVESVDFVAAQKSAKA